MVLGGSVLAVVAMLFGWKAPSGRSLSFSGLE
jgi:hypothetical protein